MQLLTQTPPVALEYWLFLYPSFLSVRNQEISPRSNKFILSNAGKELYAHKNKQVQKIYSLVRW